MATRPLSTRDRKKVKFFVSSSSSNRSGSTRAARSYKKHSAQVDRQREEALDNLLQIVEETEIDEEEAQDAVSEGLNSTEESQQ